MRHLQQKIKHHNKSKEDSKKGCKKEEINFGQTICEDDPKKNLHFFISSSIMPSNVGNETEPKILERGF